MKTITSCFEDCMQNINLIKWDYITVCTLCEKTMLMESKEYAVYDISDKGYFCMASNYSHTLFLPVYPAFNVWVLKGWNLPIEIDPFLARKNGLICIHVIGSSKAEVQTIFETLSAGTFSYALKTRILFTPINTNNTPIPLYPEVHDHLFNDSPMALKSNEMETIYVLYGKKACKLYDASFEKLYRSNNVIFSIKKYAKDTTEMVLFKTKLWGDSRSISIVEYGLLLSKLDDKGTIY